MDANTVIVTESAIRKIAAILGSEKEPSVLRVSVEGGGCSGFSYKFDLVDAGLEDDLVLEKGDARVLIDSMSVVYMDGSEIDFVDDLMGQSFRVQNPQAKSSCGCGTSFSL